MSLFNIFNVSGSAMSAQAQRLNTVASNLANADSATSATAKPTAPSRWCSRPCRWPTAATGVKVREVVEDPSPLKQVYDPKHPMADDKGYVAMPNVNVVDEMVNMLSASRSYQTNVETMNAAKTHAAQNADPRPVNNLHYDKSSMSTVNTTTGTSINDLMSTMNAEEGHERPTASRPTPTSS
jgi:flagellar basal-body rod protein FlgC